MVRLIDPIDRTNFGGPITALVTPFKNGKLDEDGFQKLVERQISFGIRGLIPVGTTGESATLNDAEHWRVFELCVEAAKGRASVIAGCGSNDTQAAIIHLKKAQELGCDGALVVAPYYNKPNQAGLLAHFNALGDATDLPIVVYNIPGRTNVDITPDTMAQISQHKNMVALKDSTGDPSRTVLHLEKCRKGFKVFAGDDNLALGFAVYGAKGVVSVLSNLAPAEVTAMQNMIDIGAWGEAAELNRRVDTLQRTLFCEPNPVPVKFALAELGLIEPDVRLPLVELSAESKKLVIAAMKSAGY